MNRFLVFTGGVAATAALVALDWFVSEELEWPGVYRLWASGTQGLEALVVLAGLVYVLAGAAAARCVELRLLRPTKLEPRDLSDVRAAAARAWITEAVATTEQLVDQPVKAYQRLISAPVSEGPGKLLLARIGPRDLLGVEEFERALAAGVVARWRVALAAADRVDGLGHVTAVVGLASTVASLVVSLDSLGATGSAGLALGAALMKCFVGMSARASCLWAREQVHARARADEVAVLNAAGPVARVAS